MSSCEQELLQCKLRELYCKKHCDKPGCEVNNFICNGRDGGNDGCEVEIHGCCCDDKKESCDYCDCCVKPMKFLLKQFTPGDQIVVATDDGNIYGDYWGNAYFVCVNDSVLTVRAESWWGEIYIEKISICHIVFVYSPDIESAKLLDNKCEPNKGYCKCCEKPIRNQLEAYCGLFVKVYLEGYWYVYGTITKVSDGIAILDNQVAVSICKVANVELYQGYYDGDALKDNKKPYMKVDELMKKREELAKKAKEEPKQ